MKVQVVIFDGFDELDAIAPFEVLRTAVEMAAVELELEYERRGTVWRR
ncbi:hypothetical protein [Synechococcus sp. PCC 7336]|nr:hypothetical protein [Synechococcus sp. PCC 7336]